MKLRAGQGSATPERSADEVLREGLLEDLRRDPTRKDLDLLRAFWAAEAKPTGLRRLSAAISTPSVMRPKPTFKDALRAAVGGDRAVTLKADFAMLEGKREVVARRARPFLVQAWQMVSVPARYAAHQIALASRRGRETAGGDLGSAVWHQKRADAYRCAAERIRRFGFFRDAFGVASFAGAVVARGLALRHEACLAFFSRSSAASVPGQKFT